MTLTAAARRRVRRLDDSRLQLHLPRDPVDTGIDRCVCTARSLCILPAFLIDTREICGPLDSARTRIRDEWNFQSSGLGRRS